jgi:nucleoside-diphosphate-sugar epimerase
MKALVTGSAGHLGEALVRVLRDASHVAVGIDIASSAYTDVIGSIADASCVREAMRGAEVVFHAATLHKPHIVTHTRQQFVDTNISGTLTLLEEAVRAGVRCVVFTSSTSAFGDALRPAEGAPAAWINEDVVAVPKNIYGVTKLAAEDLCALCNRKHGLACVVLRTSRFFLDEDDDPRMRSEYDDMNIKVNELLFRRVDLEDVVDAHLLAAEKARAIGFARFIVSATTPFRVADALELRRNASDVVRGYVPEHCDVYAERGWRMFPSIDRVYDNSKARSVLGWKPKHDFAYAIARLRAGGDPRSELARAVGAKLYHAERFMQGPYPVE